MRHQQLFICGSPAPPRRSFYPEGIEQFPIKLWGADQNVMLKISDITEKMVSKLPSVYEDLIEIATYVYSADQTTPRGGSGVQDIGEHWRRDFYFLIAVRNPTFWNQTSVKNALKELLGFLSDDFYEFHFAKLKHPPKFADYLEFPDTDTEDMVDEVVLFSGGLDSLAGAIEEIFNQNKRVALVSHRSVGKIYNKQKELINEIDKRCPRKMTYHVPIWIQKLGWKESDTSQRSRSFLYACIAATVAAMFKKNRIRFYENGVTSINLPIAEQVVGARATRTTHPKAIKGFAKLFSLVNKKKFIVETPFQWKTKTDIIQLIEKAGHGDLLKHSVSCSHVFAMTKLHSHCGRCSQCVDRRLAALAANCDKHDPKDMYKIDILVGDRNSENQDIVLTESYIRTMKECADLTDMQFFTKFGEISRAIPFIDGPSDLVAQNLYELYKRNGEQVKQAYKNSLVVYSDEIVEEKLPQRCLMSQLFGTKLQIQQVDVESGEMTFNTEFGQNVFLKKVDFWEITYSNQSGYYKDTKGLGYIAKLLRHPNAYISASDLSTNEITPKARPQKLEPEIETLITNPSVQEFADEKTLKACYDRVSSINDEFEAAKNSGNMSKQQELQDEKQKILDYVNGSTLGNRSKVFKGELNRARNAVSKSINESIGKFEQSNPELYRHFKNSISSGYYFAYIPDIPKSWIL